MPVPVEAFNPSDDELRARWTRFLNDYCKPSIHSAIKDHDEKTYAAAFTDLEKCDPALADYTLQRPRKSLDIGAQAVKLIDGVQDAKHPLTLSVRDLPKTERVAVSSLRAEHLGRFIAVEGLVKKVAPVRPLMLEAAFECKACGNIIHLIQDEEFLQEPVICDNCERQTSWRTRDELSRLVDHQRVQIQEATEGMRGGAQPERLNVYFRGDMVKTVSPGDRVRVNGILTTEARRQGNKKKTEFDKVLEAVSVEHEERSYEEVELSASDVERIVELSRGDPYRALLDSLAPGIYGHQEVKEALLMAVFGGVRTTKPDGGWLRGDIHVLLVGDPGVAKSELIFWLQHVAPRCVKTSGKGTTTAGLCVAPDSTVVIDGHEWRIEEFVEKHDPDSFVEVAPGTHEAKAVHGDTIASVGGPGLLQSVWRIESPVELVEIELESGKIVQVTPQTPLFVDGTWKKAKDICTGDAVAAVNEAG